MERIAVVEREHRIRAALGAHGIETGLDARIAADDGVALTRAVAEHLDVLGQVAMRIVHLQDRQLPAHGCAPLQRD
jgi:hypothetical protein